MAITVLQHVNRGDVIASDLFNYLIDKMPEMDRRLTTLEAAKPSGSIAIDSFEPELQQAIGQALAVNGKSFLSPAELNIVRIDDVQISAFRPSTGVRLEFLVPPLSNITAGGRNVVVSVQNATGGTVERLYRVMPAVPVAGSPPAITAIVRADHATDRFAPGVVALIQGTNFSETPSENVVTMTYTVLVSGTGKLTRVTLPQRGEPPITVTEATPNELKMTMPLVFPHLGLFKNRDITTVAVRVAAGAHPPATATILVQAFGLDVS